MKSAKTRYGGDDVAAEGDLVCPDVVEVVVGVPLLKDQLGAARRLHQHPDEHGPLEQLEHVSPASAGHGCMRVATGELLPNPGLAAPSPGTDPAAERLAGEHQPDQEGNQHYEDARVQLGQRTRRRRSTCRGSPLRRRGRWCVDWPPSLRRGVRNDYHQHEQRHCGLYRIACPLKCSRPFALHAAQPPWVVVP